MISCFNFIWIHSFYFFTLFYLLIVICSLMSMTDLTLVLRNQAISFTLSTLRHSVPGSLVPVSLICRNIHTFTHNHTHIHHTHTCTEIYTQPPTFTHNHTQNKVLIEMFCSISIQFQLQLEQGCPIVLCLCRFSFQPNSSPGDFTN